MFGTVIYFDDHRGDGSVLADNGESYYFHCVEIADGSRFLNVGTRVAMTRRVGLLGRDEAANLQSLDGSLESRT